MAFGDQIEVVSPNGELRCYELDERDGVTNVGRHPSNNVVLNGPGIADFHLMIDHRSLPYQVSLLNAGVAATIGNEVMAPNRIYPLHAWETILVGGFALILMEGSGAGASAPAATPTQAPAFPPPAVFGAAAPLATPPPVFTPPSAFTPVTPSPASATTPPIVTTAPVAASGAPTVVTPPATTQVGPATPAVAAVTAASIATAAVGSGGAAPVITPTGGRTNGQASQAVQAPVQSLGDIVDETIVLDISAREVTIDVENTASWQLTIANGGNLVARFEVHVEGWVDGSWVTIEPGFVNLFEG
jgi:hypothetical protein